MDDLISKSQEQLRELVRSLRESIASRDKTIESLRTQLNRVRRDIADALPEHERDDY